MALILDLVVQGLQMLLVLLLAPLLTGFVRKVKARLLLRRGPPLIQPYRDLARLMKHETEQSGSLRGDGCAAKLSGSEAKS